jgi:hypothetical protein
MDNEQLISFGKKYTEAWCSQKPENVAAKRMFDVDGHYSRSSVFNFSINK